MEKEAVIDILLLPSQFSDKARNKSTFSSKLRMSISHPFEENVL